MQHLPCGEMQKIQLSHWATRSNAGNNVSKMHNTNENGKNILKLNRKCKNGVHRKESSARTVQFQ